jgi:hypothetical protein
MKMKWIFKLVLLYCAIDWMAGAALPFFDLTQLLGAQTITAVSGTVRDVNGVPYVSCTVLPQFVNVSGGATPTVTATGGPVIPPTSPSTCNSSGVFNVSVIANGSVTPASTKWQFLICSAPGTSYPDPGSVGAQCFTTGQITITGSTQDITGNINAVPPPALIYANLSRNLGQYSGTTSVGITDTAFHALIAAASDIQIPANFANINPRKLWIHGSGVYTNAAASLLNAEVMLCTVSGCGSGTVVAPAGCAVTTTNQANNLTNGQFKIDCYLTTTSTVGSAGTFTAKATVCANLGAATSAADSCFEDTSAGAASSAVDETVAEFINIAFKFSTSNAGNSAILNEAHVVVLQ